MTQTRFSVIFKNIMDSPVAYTPPLVTKETILWDLENPRSVINLVSERMRERILGHRAQHPEYFDIDERDLSAKLRNEQRSVSPTDNRLRLKFWIELDYCIQYGRPGVVMERIFSGICASDFFYNVYLRSPSRVAWLMCMPTNYMSKAYEALDYGLDQLRDLLSQPHVNPETGYVNVKLGELKAKIVAMLEPRILGAIPQKTLNLHSNVTANDMGNMVGQSLEGMTMEQLIERKKKLLEENRKLTNGGIYNNARFISPGPKEQEKTGSTEILPASVSEPGTKSEDDGSATIEASPGEITQGGAGEGASSGDGGNDGGGAS